MASVVSYPCVGLCPSVTPQCRVEFYRMDISSFVYPFSYWSTPGLVTVLGYCGYSCCQHSCTSLLVHIYLGKYLGVLLSHRFVQKKLPIPFPNYLYHLTFPGTMTRGSLPHTLAHRGWCRSWQFRSVRSVVLICTSLMMCCVLFHILLSFCISFFVNFYSNTVPFLIGLDF